MLNIYVRRAGILTDKINAVTIQDKVINIKRQKKKKCNKQKFLSTLSAVREIYCPLGHVSDQRYLKSESHTITSLILSTCNSLNFNKISPLLAQNVPLFPTFPPSFPLSKHGHGLKCHENRQKVQQYLLLCGSYHYCTFFPHHFRQVGLYWNSK